MNEGKVVKTRENQREMLNGEGINGKDKVMETEEKERNRVDDEEMEAGWVKEKLGSKGGTMKNWNGK